MIFIDCLNYNQEAVKLAFQPSNILYIKANPVAKVTTIYSGLEDSLKKLKMDYVSDGARFEVTIKPKFEIFFEYGGELRSVLSNDEKVLRLF